MSAPSQSWAASRGSEPALNVMIAVSAIVHLVALGVVLALPRGFFMRTPAPVVAYTVKIVDPNALGGRLTKGELKPEQETSGVAAPAPKQEAKVEPPKVEPPPKEAKVEEPPPPPPPKEVKKPEPEPEKPAEKVVKLPDLPKKPEKPESQPKASVKPEPKVSPKPSKEEVARTTRDNSIQDAIRKLAEKGKGKESAGHGGQEEGKGAAEGIGGDGGGGGILMGLDFIIYKNQVEAIIKKNWTWVGANPNLTIRVGFSIGNDGEIADLHVVGRSGDSSYDDSVVRAIRISSPLPPPPEKYRQTFANYVLEFVSGQLAGG